MRTMGYLIGLVLLSFMVPAQGDAVTGKQEFEPAWPEREEQVERLRSERFDVLVVGGGATGAGIALDAVTRGLKVAMVERDDFAAGTSSRSTKLVHGGVRYLEKAALNLDMQQYALVKEALQERAVLLENAKHLSSALPLLTPIYSWWQVPYLWIGLKAYDWLSGDRSLGSSEYLSAKAALKRFPMLKKEGLKGAVLYYDGQFNDARVNVSLALTAAGAGAAVVNHVEVTDLIRRHDRVAGAMLKDQLTGQEWQVNARVVVNATGPYVDRLRQLDDDKAPNIVVPSAGTHIVLDKQFSPPDAGLLIPKTKDGRVLFLLPWEGGTLAGTTDAPAELEWDPKASDDDVEYILEHLREYFDMPIARSDVRSQWAGLRPLVRDPTVSDTSKLVRDHYIEVSDAGLVTISGGKWTTYRRMAEDAVNRVIAVGKFRKTTPCVTEKLPLVGSRHYQANLSDELEATYHLDEDVAKHIAHNYGSQAVEIARLATQGFGKRLSEGYPYLEAEVVYAVRAEYARTPMDVLMRRTRLYHLDQQAAVASIPRVTQLMAQELAWSSAQSSTEQREAAEALR